MPGPNRRPGLSGARSGLRAFAVAAVLALVIAAPATAVAQVIEIAPDGGVRVYDGPAVFGPAGATPIAASRPATAPVRSGRPGPGPALAGAAAAARLSPRLIEAVAWRESRFRRDAVSRAGAVGEMQLMPATARALGVNPHVSSENYWGGAAYLGGLLRRYDGDLIRALAAYNAGPGAVDRWGGVPPFKETRAYVAAILDRLSQTAAPDVEAFAQR